MLSKIYACCLLKPILTSSVHCSPVPLNALHGPNDNDTSFPSDFGEMLRRWHYVFVFPDESDDANNTDYWNSLMPDASEAWDRTHRSWRTRYQGYQPQALSSLANFIDFYIYIYFYHNEIFSEETCLVLVLLLSLTCIHNSYNRSRTLRSVPEMRFVSFLCSVVRTFSCSMHTISQKRLAWPTSKKMPMRCSGGSLPTNITQPTQTSTAEG